MAETTKQQVLRIEHEVRLMKIESEYKRKQADLKAQVLLAGTKVMFDLCIKPIYHLALNPNIKTQKSEG